jgi:hypothetical protein
VWYRWPYREETIQSTVPPEWKTVTTWQRQWGGGRLKHGPERLVLDGQEIASTMYVNGRKHGPFYKLQVRGQYVDDEVEGVWTSSTKTGDWIYTYHRGLLHGPTTGKLNNGETRFVMYDSGRIIQTVKEPPANQSENTAVAK